MSLFKSIPTGMARSSQSCHRCVRMFSSTSRTNEDQTSAFSALLSTFKKAQPQRPNPNNKQNRRDNPFNPLTARQTQQPDRPSLFGALNQGIQDINAAKKRKDSLADIQRATDRQDLERQLTRRWRAGDVYAPHDLSGVEMGKWRQTQPKGRPKRDVFDMLKLDPLEHYKNFAMMSEYISETGRIKHSRETGLRPVNQRKLARAVRRSIGLGLMPSVHKHPELLIDSRTMRR